MRARSSIASTSGSRSPAGACPGASISQWPDAARLRSAPREQQVDATISAFLGGQASPDTREILISGENPARHEARAQSEQDRRRWRSRTTTIK
jgi:hypothetical protein